MTTCGFCVVAALSRYTSRGPPSRTRFQRIGNCSRTRISGPASLAVPIPDSPRPPAAGTRPIPDSVTRAIPPYASELP